MCCSGDADQLQFQVRAEGEGSIGKRESPAQVLARGAVYVWDGSQFLEQSSTSRKSLSELFFGGMIALEGRVHGLTNGGLNQC